MRLERKLPRASNGPEDAVRFVHGPLKKPPMKENFSKGLFL